MTASDYQSAGYKMSLQVSQEIINKAEATAMNAYVLPIFPNATTQDTDVKAAVMEIAFLLMCQQNVFVTRAGAKTKNTPINSETPYSDKVSQEQVLECGRLLEVLKAKSGAVKEPKINDVAKIFFKTNYFYV